LRASLAALVVTALTAQTAAAIDYPTKQIRLIVTFTPGGPTDLLARGLARYLSETWKQSVIVENRPGAGGILTSTAVLDAPHDGYTLGVYSDGFAIAPAIYAKLPFQPDRDFIPVAQLARAANAMVVSAGGPYTTMAQIVEAGKTSGKVSYATAGIGSATHMQAATFAAAAHLVDPVHVPFRGTPESLNEVIAGRVDFEFAPLSNAVPLVAAGKLRALAVSTAERSAYLPDVPTVAEACCPGYAAEQWWGLFAPAGVPPEIVAKLEEATKAALKTAPMQDLIRQLSSTPGVFFGADFARFVTAQIAANRTAAKAADITAR
jgi:tripartite-type tricarboxylate transporter receptor subunit TctC